MIRESILSETPKTFAQVAHERRVSIPTVWRWAQRGVNGIHLETFRAGARKRHTSKEAVERFLLAVNGGATADSPPPPDDSHAKRIEAADRYVEQG